MQLLCDNVIDDIDTVRAADAACNRVVQIDQIEGLEHAEVAALEAGINFPEHSVESGDLPFDTEEVPRQPKFGAQSCYAFRQRPVGRTYVSTRQSQGHFPGREH